jgi:hypothetical protein
METVKNNDRVSHQSSGSFRQYLGRLSQWSYFKDTVRWLFLRNNIVYFSQSNTVDDTENTIKDKRHKYTVQQLENAVPTIEALTNISLANGYHKFMFEPDFIAKIVNVFSNAVVLQQLGISETAFKLICTLSLNKYERFSEDIVKQGVPTQVLQCMINSDKQTLYNHSNWTIDLIYNLVGRPHVHDLLVQDESFLATLQSAAAQKEPITLQLVSLIVKHLLLTEIRDVQHGDHLFQIYLSNNKRFIREMNAKLQEGTELDEALAKKIKADELSSYSDMFDKTTVLVKQAVDIGYPYQFLPKLRDGWNLTEKAALYSVVACGCVALRALTQSKRPSITPMCISAFMYTIFTVYWFGAFKKPAEQKVLNYFTDEKKGITSPRLHYVAHQSMSAVSEQLVFLALFARFKYLFMVGCVLSVLDYKTPALFKVSK